MPKCATTLKIFIYTVHVAILLLTSFALLLMDPKKLDVPTVHTIDLSLSWGSVAYALADPFSPARPSWRQVWITTFISIAAFCPLQSRFLHLIPKKTTALSQLLTMIFKAACSNHGDLALGFMLASSCYFLPGFSGVCRGLAFPFSKS